MEAQFPESATSPEAREGTAAHFFATELIEGRTHPAGTIAPNGEPITDEMVDGGMVLAADVWAAIEEVTRASPTLSGGVPSYWLRTEQFVTMHSLIHPDNEGTLDVALVASWAKTIVLWDYKFGHGAVEVFHNPQLIDYLAGVLEAHELTREDIADWRVSLRIVQPRNYRAAGPVQVWNMVGESVWPRIEWLSGRAAAAADVNAQTRTGPWCDDCTARAFCPALLAAGGASIDRSREAVPHELPIPALGLQLKQINDALDRLGALRSGLEEVVEAQIRAGRSVPFFELKDQPGRLNWTVPVAEILQLGQLMGVDLAKKQAITPTQAIDAGLDEEIINEYAKRNTARKLVQVDSNSAEKVFS